MGVLVFAKFATYVCFMYWALATIGVLLMQIFHPEPVHGKLNLRRPRDLLLVTSIMSWFAMWCFRSTY